MTDLLFHPIANVLPLIEGKPFDELVQSIKESGLRDPIILLEGLILDGRNRYRACLEAGIKPRTEEFSGGDPIKFVQDHNLHRRHLTPNQKALAVQKYETFAYQGRPKRVLKNPLIRTRPQIAKSTGTSVSSLKRAKVVNEHGTAEEIASVMNGASLALVAAKIRVRHGGKPDGRSLRSGPRGMTEKRKLQIFYRLFSLFCNHADDLEDVFVPKLDAEQREDAERKMKDVARKVSHFRKRIADGGST